MEIITFTDQYELAAPAYNVTADELRSRDRRQDQPIQRWLATSGNAAVGAVRARLRPDDRAILSFVGRDLDSYVPLTETVAAAMQRTVHTFADAGDAKTLAALEQAGFETELVMEAFRIRFDHALAWTKRAWIPSGFSILSAATADEDRLFALDNTLRQDTPGTDGWRGNREWFHDELTESPPFHPAAYLVAADDRNGEYVGLIRIWRNDDGPRLGLIGVRRRNRNTVIAMALLNQALTAAAQWGHDTFTAETSLSNRVIHPRLVRLGAESTGRTIQLIRRWEE